MEPEHSVSGQPGAAPNGRVPATFAVKGLFVLAVFYTIFLTRTLLLPVVMAVLLTCLLAPIVRALARVGVPRLAGAALVVLALLTAVTLLGTRLVEPAAGWIEKAPYSLHALESKIRPLKIPVEKMTRATEEIEKITDVPSNAGEERVRVAEKPFLDTVMDHAHGLLAGLVTIVVLLFFMLAYEHIFVHRMIEVMPNAGARHRVADIVRDVSSHVSRYLLTITTINAGLGIVIGVAMHVLGLPNPILWGVLAMVLNFVPYLGAIVGTVAVAMAGILSYDTLGRALVFPAVYYALTLTEGAFITPMILGRSFTLNPIVVVLGLIFWTWLWGIPGTLLAVPILVTFRIFCEHIEPLAPLRPMLEHWRGRG